MGIMQVTARSTIASNAAFGVSTIMTTSNKATLRGPGLVRNAGWVPLQAVIGTLS